MHSKPSKTHESLETAVHRDGSGILRVLWRWGCGLGLIAVLFCASPARGEANYVYHEQTTNSPGCGAGYMNVLVPNSSTAVTIRFKVEFQFYTDTARLYYTTDGSTPAGASGVGSGTTQVATASYDCTFGSPLVDVCSATIPAHPAGTTVKYIVSAWHASGGSEIFANGPGTPCGCGTPTSSSSAATVFQYTVTNDGTWVGGGGNWSDTSKWSNGTVAKGVGATATINLGVSGNTALTNDSAITIGTLQLSNSGGQNFDLRGNGSTLTFDVVSGAPLLGVNSYFGKAYTLGAGNLTIAGNDGLKVEVGSNTVRPVSGLSWTGFSGTLEITCSGGTGGWDPQAGGLMPAVNLNLATGAGNLIFGMYNGRNQTIGGLDGSVRAYLNNNAATSGNGALTVGQNDGGGTFAGVVGGDNSNPSKGGVSIIKNGTGTQTFSGVIAGASGTTETVTANNGTLILSGNNTYNGATTVNSGATLKLGHANGLGATGSSALTKVNSGGVLDLNGQTTGEQFGDTGSNDGFTGTGISSSGALINSSGTAAEIAGGIYGNAGWTVGGAGNIKVNLINRRNSGVSTVTLTKTGSGTLTIAGSADNSTMVLSANGGTTVLAKNSTSSARAATDATIGSGGTIKFDPSQGTVTGSLNWGGQINGTMTLNAGGILDLNGSTGQNSRFQQLVGAGGLVSNSSATAATLEIAARNGNTYEFAGTVADGVGTVALNFQTVGTTGSGRTNVLSGNNSYSGGTIINHSVLRMGHDNALGTGSVTVGAGSGGTLDLNGHTLNNTITQGGNGGSWVNTSATKATVAGNFIQATISDFSVGGTGNIDWNGAIQRSSFVGTITKSGGNTVTLGGSIANSGMNWNVTGGTLVLAKSGALAVGNNLTVNGGGVRLNAAGGAQGQIGDSSTVTLTSGSLDLNGFSETIGTLTGAGSVLNTATVSALTVGGTVAPGNSGIGTLTCGSGANLALGAATLIDMELGDTPAGDKISSSAGISCNGRLKLRWVGSSLASGATYDLFDGTLTGGFTSLEVANWPSASLRVNTNALYSTGVITIEANAAPVAKNLTNGVAQGGSALLPIIGGKHGPTDADGDAMSVTSAVLVTPANGGNISVIGGTGVVYTASASFSGTDSFAYTVTDTFGASDTKTVTVMVTPAGTGANIMSISGSAPTLTVQAQGVPNAVYQLQYTTNLTTVNWQDVSGAGGTATASSLTGAMTFTDTNATNASAWYRTRHVSGP